MLIIGLVFFSCNENNSIVEPDIGSAQIDRASSIDASARKGATLTSSTDVITNTTLTSNLVVNSFKQDVTMDGAIGGTINFNYNLRDGRQLVARLTLEPGSYSGIKSFTVYFDLDKLTVILLPHGDFLIPAHLDLRYKGYNLKTYFPGLTKKSIPNFYYFPEDGSTPQVMKYASCSYDTSVPIITFYDCRLPHFSRFGFCR